MATLTVSDTDKRDGKALALFARCQEWQQGRTKDGRSFFAIPSGSLPGLFQMTDCNDCSCKDRQTRAVACYHMRAVRLWMAAFRTGAVAPKRGAGTAQDDLVILTPAGAAHLAELAAQDRAQAAATDPHADCVVTDETHVTLESLRTDQKARAKVLRLIGYAPGEEIEDRQYAQRAAQIARLEACLSHAVA